MTNLKTIQRLLGLVAILLIIPLANSAFAATATVTSAQVTGPNQVTIVFSDPLDWVIGDFTDLNINAGARNVVSIAETAPSSTVTITFDGAAVNTASIGDIDIAAIADGGSGNDFAGATNQALSDGQSPPAPVLSYSGSNPTNANPVSFSVDFGEDINAATFTVGDVTVSSGTVANIVDTGDGQNFTFDVSAPTDGATLSAQVTGNIDDLAGNTVSADSNTETVDIDYGGPTLTPVSIASNNANPAFAKNGDTITVTITGGETLSNVVGTIDGEVATIVNTIGNTWTASLTLSGDETEGITTFSVSADDSLGNTSTVTATTDASSLTIDLTAPVVTGSTTNINDGGSTVKTLADQYAESCSATDINPASPTCTVQSGSIDTSVLGLQSVVYEATDSAGNVGTDTVSTTMITGNAPVITLTGANPQSINLGNPYVELGATASDVEDGDITGSIIIDASAVNTAVIGSYIVTYDVTDSSGNTDHEERTVNVVTGNVPVITILGNNPANIDFDGTYVDAGATALDVEDGDLTGLIITTGLPIDGFTSGTYTVTYQVTDSNSNTVQATRTVVVGLKPVSEGRSCGGDCYHPHLGVDQNNRVFYEDGLKINGITYKIDNVLHNHPEKLIELPIGEKVTMKAKVQDTYPDNIERCELSIGIPKGKFDKSLAAFKIGINRSFDGQVTNYYEGDLEAFRDVETSMVNEGNLVMCTWHFTPTKHLEHDMFAVEVMDTYRYTGTYYVNEGVAFRGISEVGTPVYDVMDSFGRVATITIVDLTLEDLTEAVDQNGNLWHLIDGKWAKDFIRPDMSCNTTDRNCASGHTALILAQQEIAKKYFDSSEIQGELKPSFAYDYPDRSPRGEQPHKTASSVCEKLQSYLARNPDVVNHSSCKLE